MFLCNFFLNIISIYLAFLAFIDGSGSPQNVVVAQADSPWAGKNFASKTEKLNLPLICCFLIPTKTN